MLSRDSKRKAIALFIVIAFVCISYQIARANNEPKGYLPAVLNSKNTPRPEIVPTPNLTPHGRQITVKISHYDPNLGGTNCARWEDGGCTAHMANGEPWEKYFGQNNTIACPPELPFDTRINFGGDAYTCRDRGGAIIITGEGYYWIDILAESVPYKYGELKDAWITYIP
jgi:hypothetical protein